MRTSEQPQHDASGHGLAHHRVADPVHLGQRQEQQAERDASDGGARPLRAPFPQHVGPVLELVKDGLEPVPEQPGTQAEHHDEEVSVVVRDGHVVGDAGEEGRRAEEGAAHEVAR